MQQRTVNRGNTSVNYTLPAPIGGLNVRDSLDLMSETDAIVMDNYIPSETMVKLRKGYSSYINLSVPIKTLLAYNKSGSERFLACGGGKIFDITAPSKLKELATGFINNQWQYCQFKDYLIMVNGKDEPQTFYNSGGQFKLETALFTGQSLLLQKLVNVCVSKQRLFFVENSSLNFWYSDGVGEVQGILKKFDLSSVFRLGGKLLAICPWTIDGGSGIDDLTVFITSEGEVAVYSGNDPSSAADWSLRGVYQMSKPIGYRCLMQYQGDVIIISEDGYVPLSKALSINQANTSQISFSDKIRGLVLERTRNNYYKFGWQSIIYGREGIALFNVPTGQQFEQHIVNINTGAWCRFTGIRAFCWGIYNSRLYFGSDEGVFLADEGYSDNGMHIMGQVKQAYSNLGSPNLKRIQLINPRTKSSNRYALVVYTDMDFATQNKDYAENIGSSGITKWGKATWSSLANPIGSKWATLKGKIRSQWIGNSATGFKAGVVFKTKTRGNLIEWYDTGFRYEQGNNIL